MNDPEKSPQRGRGRPPGFDRQKALDAAIDVFWARGYEGASIDDLTSAMGLNRSSLYQAFGDKRALFSAALDRYGDTMGSAPLLAFRAAKGSFREAALVFLRTALENQTRADHPRGCLVTCVLADSAGLDAASRERLAAILQATDAELAARVAGARDAGELPATTDPHALAVQLSSLMHSLSLRARAAVPADRLWRDAQAVLDRLVPGPLPTER
jgi:AcrR family transcriptional regulator